MRPYELQDIRRMPSPFRLFRSQSHRLTSLLVLGFAATLFVSTALAAPTANAQPAPAQDLPPALNDANNSALAALPRARDLNTDQRKQSEDLLHDAQTDDQAATDALAKRQGFLDAALKAAPIDAGAPPAAGGAL